MSGGSEPRIVLAPNAFKGSFDAVELVEIWAGALEDVAVDRRPMSDGGDGFVGVVRRYRPGVLELRARTRDALGRPIEAAWGWDPDAGVAWIESAAAIGMRRLADGEGDPARAATDGLGILVDAALRLGAARIEIGLGGSATVDGGLGMARALGFAFEDADGRPVERAADLEGLARIVPPAEPPAGGAEVTALADVRNPLLGPRGAARVFGPQKGAGPELVERLERGLARMAERWTEDLGVDPDLAGRPGAGAAGGLGAATAAFLGARVVHGPDRVAELAGLDDALDGADGVVTGEGHYDGQSAGDKAPGRVLDAAREAGVPAAIVAGRVEGDPPEGVVALDAADLGLAADARLDEEALGRLVQRAVERLLERG